MRAGLPQSCTIERQGQLELVVDTHVASAMAFSIQAPQARPISSTQLPSSHTANYHGRFLGRLVSSR